MHALRQSYTVMSHSEILWYIYRPQTKFAKVMFLHLSVSHSVHRVGVSRPMPRDGGVCPGGGVQAQARGVQAQVWGAVSQHALRQTPPRCGRYASSGMHSCLAHIFKAHDGLSTWISSLFSTGEFLVFMHFLILNTE